MTRILKINNVEILKEKNGDGLEIEVIDAKKEGEA